MRFRQDKTPHSLMLFVAIALLVVCLFHTTSSWAWENPSTNIDVFESVTPATVPHLVSDGAHGAIIVSGSNNGPASPGIFAQRIDANGSSHAGWPDSGVQQQTTGQDSSKTISDGAGGSIVVWEDYRNIDGTTDIYAQRFDASGTALWDPNGVPVCLATEYQSYPELVSDGAGGAIITWYDLRSGAQTDIYAQRIAASDGHPLWTTDGVAVCTAPNYHYNPEIVSDGLGGAIVVWEETLSDAINRASGIYAQRINAADGSAVWAVDGVAVSTGEYQYYPKLASDRVDGSTGANGAIVVWQDDRFMAGFSDIYAQRIDAGDGHALWTTDGVTVTTAAGDQWNPHLVSNGTGGAFIVWEDYRSDSSTSDIFAQMINAADGSAAWATDGVAVSSALSLATNTPVDQVNPQLSRVGTNGAVIVWEDYRNDPNGLSESTGGVANIYAQWIASNGVPVWTPADGVAVSQVANGKNPQILSDDLEGAGGAIIVWEDYRNFDPGIYAQRIIGLDGSPSSFDLASFDLKFTAGPNGTLAGRANQTVISGTSGTAVKAVAYPGHRFVKWSDNVSTAERTDLNVSADISATAIFAIDSYTLTYTAQGMHGWIDGTALQTVNSGGSGTRVTAVSLNGYHFVSWSDGKTTDARTDANVVADMSLTAFFAPDPVPGVCGSSNGGTFTSAPAANLCTTGAATGVTGNGPWHWSCSGANGGGNASCSASIQSYTLTYSAGAHGTISGSTPQTIISGGSGAAVTAMPQSGYHFVSWSDDVTTAARTDTNVTHNISVTATFAANAVTGACGSSNGGTFTSAPASNLCTTGTASGVTGSGPWNWSCNGANGSGNASCSANIQSYTLTYSAGANGSITGTTPQKPVNYGTSGASVTAVPATGYHFVSWSDGIKSAARTDANVTGNISATASFAINSYTLTYSAGANGSITGTTPQTVDYGTSGTAVTAVPAAGYHFVNWTGDNGFVASTVNPLVVSNVKASQNITANFVLIDGILTPAPGKAKPDLNDALRVLRIAMDHVVATANDMIHADIAPLGANNKPKGDGVIDIYDVIGILRMTVGLN